MCFRTARSPRDSATASILLRCYSKVGKTLSKGNDARCAIRMRKPRKRPGPPSIRIQDILSAMSPNAGMPQSVLSRGDNRDRAGTPSDRLTPGGTAVLPPDQNLQTLPARAEAGPPGVETAFGSPISACLCPHGRQVPTDKPPPLQRHDMPPPRNFRMTSSGSPTGGAPFPQGKPPPCLSPPPHPHP